MHNLIKKLLPQTIAAEIEKQTGLVMNFNDQRLLVYGKK